MQSKPMRSCGVPVAAWISPRSIRSTRPSSIIAQKKLKPRSALVADRKDTQNRIEARASAALTLPIRRFG